MFVFSWFVASLYLTQRYFAFYRENRYQILAPSVSNDADGLSIFARRTRFRATPGLMLFSLELTVANLLEVISLRTPRPHGFF